MKFKLLGLFVLFLLLFTSTVSYAAQFQFTPRTTARETYTDNVFLDDNDKEDDYITEATVGGTFSILGKTSGLNLSFDPGYVWYANNTRDDTWRLPATLRIYNDFSRRTRFTIFDRFLRTEDPEEDRDVVNEETGRVEAPGDSSVRTGRDWYYTNYASARVDHQFGSDDSVYAGFVYSLRREEANDGNDNDRYAPSAGIAYWFGPKWGTTLDATYTRATFDNSADYHDIEGIFQLNRRLSRQFSLFGRYGYAYRDNDNDDFGEDDYMVHAPSVGFNYELAPDARISLGVGYYYQDIDGGGNKQGLFLNGDIYKLWNYQRWTASLRGTSGLDRADFGTERLGFVWASGVTGTARYNFTRTFYGTLNAGYRFSDYINESRKDHRAGGGGGLGWQPLTWMIWSLEYNHRLLSSNDVEDYNENRVWLRLTLSPNQPWRF